MIAYRQRGAGPGVIVVGGALSSGQDYLPLASVLARSMTAYVIDRRGRGHSGPQGPDYSMA
ncbi:MAG: alpha/beta fold hydrolase, partial [Solirubrobacteraceae bacterium]